MNDVTATAPYNGPEGTGTPLSDDNNIEAQWAKYKVLIISIVAVVILGVLAFGLLSNHMCQIK